MSLDISSTAPPSPGGAFLCHWTEDTPEYGVTGWRGVAVGSPSQADLLVTKSPALHTAGLFSPCRLLVGA